MAIMLISQRLLALWQVCLLLLCVVSSSSGARGGGPCASQLPGLIERLIQQPEHITASYGILIERPQASNASSLFALNPQVKMVPASNTKVLTSAALFLNTDASKFTFKTPFFVSGSGQQGKAISAPLSLCVKGMGDPSLAYADLERAAAMLHDKGIFELDSLVIDDSFFHGQGQPFPSSWEWEDIQADYGAQPRSIILNENAIMVTVTPTQVGQPVSISFSSDAEQKVVSFVNEAVTLPANSASTLTVGYPLADSKLLIEGGLPVNSAPREFGMSIMDPVKFFGDVLAFALQTKGIKIGKILNDRCQSSTEREWIEIFSLESAPLSDLMNHTLQVSDNLYAETFARTLGARFIPSNASTGSTLRDGLSLISKTLAKIGVGPSTFAQADGSGLSVQNMVSPRALVETLRGLYRLPNGQGALFRSMLPLAGRTGSLEHRFIGTPAEGKVWAKTGSMTGVSSLSGYVKNVNFSEEEGMLLFSILVNGNSMGQSAARTVIDQIVVNLAQIQNC